MHQVVFGIMPDQAEAIEANDFAQEAGEIMDQGIQIPVSDDCLRDRQKRLVLLTGRKRRL